MVEVAAPPGTGELRRRAVRAALTRRPAAAALPDTRLVLRSAGVDLERLAGYARVCGFRLADTLPITYPHVLAFPLAMRLLSDPRFPLPVIGLVHVANRVTQSRPLRTADRPALTVYATDLRPHDRGRQVDVVAAATLGDVEVWRGVSTYLHRDKGARSGRPAGAAEPPAADAPPTAVWHVGAGVGRDYAAVSGDANPIHTSRIGARLFGFPRPIAHGMWTLAHAVAALDGRLPDAYTVAVEFRKPLALPSTVDFRAGRATDGDGWTLSVRDPRTGAPHLRGAVTPV